MRKTIRINLAFSLSVIAVLATSLVGILLSASSAMRAAPSSWSERFGFAYGSKPRTIAPNKERITHRATSRDTGLQRRNPSQRSSGQGEGR